MVRSQSYSMLSTLYTNYAQYQDYLTNGPYEKSVASQEKLVRGTALLKLYIDGSLTGRSGLMDSCKTAFDALYGKTHVAPDISIGSLSYIKLDSISFDDGATWINSVYPKDSILSWIGSGGTDSSTVVNLILANSINLDTLNNHLQIFRDTLDVTQDVKDSVLNWIGDSVLNSSEIVSLITANSINLDTLNAHLQTFRDTASFLTSVSIASQIHDSIAGLSIGKDSSFAQVTTSTLLLTDSPSLGNITTGLGGSIQFKHYSTGYTLDLDMANGILYGSHPLGNDLRLDFFGTPSSTSPNIFPKYSDPNTGYSWVSADKLGLVAGGVSTFTSEYNAAASKVINRFPDSVRISSGLVVPKIFPDSVYSGSTWIRNVIGYGDVPSEDALRMVSSSGVQSWKNVSDLVPGGTAYDYEPDSVNTSDTLYVKVFSKNKLHADWAVFYGSDSLSVTVLGLHGSLTDGAPTESEINTITSLTPSTSATNILYYIKDDDGSGLIYTVMSDGTVWHYWTSTIAL